MDTRTGKIVPEELIHKLNVGDKKNFIPMKLPPTRTQMLRRPPRVGRNEPCPCGSGKKFKHCHLQEKGK